MNMTRADLTELVKQAKDRYDAMTPADKANHDYEQRRSFVRGMCPSKRDYNEWCEVVDRVLPPMRAV
jgi:hypothetical protein